MAKPKKTFVKKQETAIGLMPKKENKFKFGKRGLLSLIGLIVVLLVLGVVLFFLNSQNISLAPQTPEQKTASETKSLLDKVGELMVLPQENPKIATVTDVSKLLDQPFFAQAKNGDKVLIYNSAARVILFRPSIDKIIDVAPLNTNITTEEKDAPVAKITESPATAVILNGTLTLGLARDAQAKVSSNIASITVSRVGDSLVGGYDQTVVIDISGKHKSQVENLAKLFNGKVEASVPSGENSPTSDILIILGDNYEK